MLDQGVGAQAIEVSQGAVRKANRIGILAVVISFAAFLVWASFAPLAQGAVSYTHLTLPTKA